MKVALIVLAKVIDGKVGDKIEVDWDSNSEVVILKVDGDETWLPKAEVRRIEVCEADISSRRMNELADVYFDPLVQEVL